MDSLRVCLLFLVFAYLCSVGVRCNQYFSVTGSPAYLTEDNIILTTHDGYRWTRYAADYADGIYTDGADELAGVPETVMKPPRLPLISLFTAELSSAAGISLEKAGGMLSVFLPGLFIFPLGILLYLLGFPSAGVGAGLLGALSFAYLSRTSAFQIDTDMLNLFFISLGSLFAYMASRGRPVLWSALAGLSMYLFWRWYFHSGFTVIFFAMLLYALRGKTRRQIFLSYAVYILCASPFVFMNGFAGLYEFINPSAVRSFHAEVDELSRIPLPELLTMITPYRYISAGLVLSSLLLGRRVFWFAVFYLLGALAFFKGVRFAMFLPVLCGAGLGLISDFIFKKRKALSFAVVTAIALLVLVRPYLKTLPPPVTDAGTYSVIKMLNDTEPDAVIASIWDNGFLIEYLTGRRVFADGASQFKQGTEIFADALFSTDSKKAWHMLKKPSGGKPVYLLFTPDMDMKISAIMKSAGFIMQNDGGSGANEIFLRSIDKLNSGKTIKLADSLYFRLHVIGETDISCFDKIYSDNRHRAIYRLTDECG